MNRSCRAMLVLGGVIGVLPGCHERAQEDPYWPIERKDYGRPLPPGELALRRIEPASYPDFSEAYYHQDSLKQAIEGSLSYLAKPSSREHFPYGPVTHERAVATLLRFRSLIEEVTSAEQFDAAVKREFDVYQSVGWDHRGTVYFTGYYCPIFEGRRRRQEPFVYPLYSAPSDLVKGPDGRILGRRDASGEITSCHTRRELEEGGLLAGHEIAWLKDPFEAYVATVQGSVKLRLEDGSLYELGYAANNGYPYTSIGQLMVADGVIRSDELSLQTLLHYFAEHPEQVSFYCRQNDRYVFFQEESGGPYGSLNVPVTSFKSIATDKQVYPRACLAFVDTQVPRMYRGEIIHVPFRSFALDQDTGGAIRAAGRCDIYMGVGQEAEALAGRTGAEGRLYYIFLKDFEDRAYMSARSRPLDAPPRAPKKTGAGT